MFFKILNLCIINILRIIYFFKLKFRFIINNIIYQNIKILLLKIKKN
mgnify:CR=1 FL=1